MIVVNKFFKQNIKYFIIFIVFTFTKIYGLSKKIESKRLISSSRACRLSALEWFLKISEIDKFNCV